MFINTEIKTFMYVAMIIDIYIMIYYYLDIRYPTKDNHLCT